MAMRADRALWRKGGGKRTDGADALVDAASSGDTQLVNQLLQKGGSPNWLGSDGRSPLYGAVANGHDQVVRLLLCFGADTSLHSCEEEGDTALVRASRMGHADICLQLLLHGANPHQANVEGVLPLVVAAQNGHINIVRFLLAHGADQRRRDRSGLTPLGAATSEGHVEVVKLLLATRKRAA
jgi:uncharacterized protein